MVNYNDSQTFKRLRFIKNSTVIFHSNTLQCIYDVRSFWRRKVSQEFLFFFFTHSISSTRSTQNTSFFSCRYTQLQCIIKSSSLDCFYWCSPLHFHRHSLLSSNRTVKTIALRRRWCSIFRSFEISIDEQCFTKSRSFFWREIQLNVVVVFFAR